MKKTFKFYYGCDSMDAINMAEEISKHLYDFGIELTIFDDGNEEGYECISLETLEKEEENQSSTNNTLNLNIKYE